MKTLYSLQEAINILAGNGKTEYSVQEALNIYRSEASKTLKSEQNIANELEGSTSPVDLTIEEDWFGNISTAASLDGTKTDYTAQELANIAIDNELSLGDLLGE